MVGVESTRWSQRPDAAALEGSSLGAKLRKRRRDIGLRRCDAALQMGVNWKTLMWWERDDRRPADRYYPAVITFLGEEPWPEPQSLGERLTAERRRRGLSIDRAAALIGVDEESFRRWESGGWSPSTRSLALIARFLR